MILKPITCPNCTASIKLDRIDELVTCQHCESSFFVDWPDDDDDDIPIPHGDQPARKHFFIVLGTNPFAACPFCSAQVLRTADNADKEISCNQCQQTALMPALTTQAAKVCRQCHRAHFEFTCPDCTRDRRDQSVWKQLDMS